jgi:hypothetical protein
MSRLIAKTREYSPKTKDTHQGTQPTIKKRPPRCAPQEDDHCNETCVAPQNPKKKINLEDNLQDK